MTALEQAIARLEELGKYGFRPPTQYIQVTDSLAFVRQDLELVKQSLNELERLKKFKETFDNYELAKKQDFIAYENWQECERELTELRHDVKRYFDLANVGEVTKEVIDEFSKIRNKLLEVGNEDE